jgi:hypothetical protein
MLLKRLMTLATISVCLSCAQSGSGGDTGTGGSTSTGGTTGTGGATSTGGDFGTGGFTSTGGVVGTGGNKSTGGTIGTGGVVGTGGNSATGGSVGTGGNSATGGSVGTGGNSATGGSVGTGGTTGTGGTGAAPAFGTVENSGSNCTATAGALLSADNKLLPNPFAMHDGTIISTKAQWECRRNEVKKDLEQYEIGPKQEPPTVAATLSGKTMSVKVTVGANSITLTSAISGSGSCVVVGMNGTTSLVSGCTEVPFSTDQVVMYSQTNTQNQSDPFYKLYPSLYGHIGNYSAWAWGVSRLIDGLAQLQSQLNIDMTKISTWGCSYAGKMSLFAGAFDERVALTIVEESGGGGIDSWRMSQEFVDRTGVQVEKIDNTNYSWFMSSMKSLDPYKLPHDHHELIAMIAPRAVIILGNDGYDWLGDESGYKSTMAALQVFTALGVPNNIGYDFTSNHAHCSAPTTQQNSINTFVTRFLKGGTTPPNIAIKPPSTTFDLNWQADVPWTNPTLN